MGFINNVLPVIRNVSTVLGNGAVVARNVAGILMMGSMATCVISNELNNILNENSSDQG